jgi:hypothetical protein
MTPAAITPAGRAATKRTGGHKLRRQPAPKVPRRVSGPVRGRLADTVTSRPSRPAASRHRSAPLGARTLAFVRALPDHPLLDRLIRGRAWIPVLGVMLAGIVAMQVEVLKLGASMGRSIERGTTLQSRNDQLRLSVAALEGDGRIERIAAASGMIMPAPDAVGFLSSRSGALVDRALANIHPPDAPGFLSLLSSNGALATASNSQPTDPASAFSASSSQGTSSATAPAASSATVPATSTPTSAGTGDATAQSGSGQTESPGSSSGGAGIPVGG